MAIKENPKKHGEACGALVHGQYVTRPLPILLILPVGIIRCAINR